MFLKSLALRGFKTFADSTEIEFGPEARITAIVGPNGCGKSNLLDATRWVLGEDNPRDLRVATLPDIIFAGTDRRKPLSLAEVTMLLDNSSAKLPVPFTEVAIRRRTFREGESEFFINKNLCRLKDIKDLLLDTGLGEGTYSIITQGQVDAILSSKGEERRAVFEEAAGINKYKTRKLAAEKKLIAAEQNILRISDLKVEVSEHLINLEEQARRAREYLKLQALVKETEIGLCKRLLSGILERRAKIEEELALAQKATAEKVAEERKDEEELCSLKETLRRIEIEIEERLVKLDAEKDRLRDLELNRRFIEGEVQREEKLLRDLKTKREELQQKTEALKTNIKGVNSPHFPPKAGLPQAENAGNLADSLELLIQQAQELINHLSSILVFFGKDNPFRLLGEKEMEATIKLKLELLEEEEKRLEEEAERTRFGLQAHRGELEGLTAPETTSESKTTLIESLAKIKQERENLKQKINELEEKIRREEKIEREKSDAATSLEIALAKLEGEMLGISEKLSAEYNLTLPELEALPYTVSNVTKAKTEVDEGKRSLRQLEPVNLLAIDEYDKTRERLSFIEAQLADLASARENLRNLIVELDKRAEEAFVQAMQELSVIFSETFSKLFAGGEAKISLTPGAPALEADIEIAVRPAGRRWLSLSLLSGGERSLCAIAILFSLMKIRPSPFCFLDEVDAALDEANIDRFTNMLKDFSSATQIIVITHNKRTMSVANNIYGVTMEEAGVSKVISMKLTEAVA